MPPFFTCRLRGPRHSTSTVRQSRAERPTASVTTATCTDSQFPGVTFCTDAPGTTVILRCPVRARGIYILIPSMRTSSPSSGRLRVPHLDVTSRHAGVPDESDQPPDLLGPGAREIAHGPVEHSLQARRNGGGQDGPGRPPVRPATSMTSTPETSYRSRPEKMSEHWRRRGRGRHNERGRKSWTRPK